MTARKRPTWFAAVQIQENEDAHKAVWDLLQVVAKEKIKFTALEVFSVELIARTRFVRFRSDLDLRLVQDQLSEAGIGYISFTDGVNGPTYEATLVGDVRGRVPMERMQAIPVKNHWRIYRGTRNRYWKRQFRFAETRIN